MNSSKKEIVTKMQEVTPFKQRYDWDCGVTCVLMVLNDEQRRHFLDNFDKICAEEGFGKSTWSIDLCYLLSRYEIRHMLYTTMMGVNGEYMCLSQYHNIANDRLRIERKFKVSLAYGILVYEDHITMIQIMNHLIHHGPVILLVDANLLVCDDCNYNKLMSELRRCSGSSYRGHYIVLTGVAGGSVYYRNPARSPRRCCRVSASKLGAAAAARGTDNDCILVFRSRI